MSDVEVTEEHRATAHALCLAQGICDVGCGEALCEAIAFAFAEREASSRRDEQEACANHVAAIATAFGEAILAYRKKGKVAPQHMFDKYNLLWETQKAVRFRGDKP